MRLLSRSSLPYTYRTPVRYEYSMIRYRTKHARRPLPINNKKENKPHRSPRDKATKEHIIRTPRPTNYLYRKNTRRIDIPTSTAGSRKHHRQHFSLDRTLNLTAPKVPKFKVWIHGGFYRSSCDTLYTQYTFHHETTTASQSSFRGPPSRRSSCCVECGCLHGFY